MTFFTTLIVAFTSFLIGIFVYSESIEPGWQFWVKRSEKYEALYKKQLKENQELYDQISILQPLGPRDNVTPLRVAR